MASDNSKVWTSEGIAAAQELGYAPVVGLSLYSEGKEIPHYRSFSLSQSASGHHRFTLILNHDSLGKPQDYEMEDARKLIGKRLTATFSYKNMPSSPERDFVGVITGVSLHSGHRGKGDIILEGYSPTILLDGAPNTRSFGGGGQAVSLNYIVGKLIEEAFGGKYRYKTDPRYTGNLEYSSQYAETAYNYLLRLAAAYGETFFYDGEQLNFGKLTPSQATIPLTFGRDVEEIDVRLQARHVKRTLYGYSSRSNERLSSVPTDIEHQSYLAKQAYAASEKTFNSPSLQVAPMKALFNKDIEASQKSVMGSEAVNVFITTGKTSVPFLYPGCLVTMSVMNPVTKQEDYMTRLTMTEVQHKIDAQGHYTCHFEAIAYGTGYLPVAKYREPVAEPQPAVVVANKDPWGQGRVQVRFLWQSNADTTAWIRVMTPDAGGSGAVSKNRGFMAIPEVGDQVMVGFVHNHPDRPFVMGGMFHGGNAAGGGVNNNIKSISSKSGHTIQLDDGAGITVKDKAGNSIEADGSGNITATSSDSHTTDVGKGQSTIKMDKNGNISITSKTQIEFKVGSSVITIKADSIEIQATNNKITGTNNTVSGTNRITGGNTKIDGGNAFVN